MTVPIPALPGYIFRFARREGLPAIHQMLIRTADADRTGYVDILDDLINEFSNDSYSDPEKDFLLALTADGQVAGIGRGYVNPTPQHEQNAGLGGLVHPDHRSRGLGNQILRWMKAHARQRLLEFPANLPRALRTSSLDYLVDRITLFEQHGFSPIRSFYRMRRYLI